jgi:hypothetical protein
VLDDSGRRRSTSDVVVLTTIDPKLQSVGGVAVVDELARRKSAKLNASARARWWR